MCHEWKICILDHPQTPVRLLPPRCVYLILKPHGQSFRSPVTLLLSEAKPSYVYSILKPHDQSFRSPVTLPSWATYVLNFKTRGCPIIIRTDILHHTSKTIAPRVKSQARGQNNWSRALKWGIAHFCNPNMIRGVNKNKRCLFLNFRSII